MTEAELQLIVLATAGESMTPATRRLDREAIRRLVAEVRRLLALSKEMADACRVAVGYMHDDNETRAGNVREMLEDAIAAAETEKS